MESSSAYRMLGDPGVGVQGTVPRPAIRTLVVLVTVNSTYPSPEASSWADTAVAYPQGSSSRTRGRSP